MTSALAASCWKTQGERGRLKRAGRGGRGASIACSWGCQGSSPGAAPPLAPRPEEGAAEVSVENITH